MTPYQILVPLVSLVAIGYAWSLVKRQKKTVWEAILWTIFWGIIAAVAFEPKLLNYLTAATGIKDQVNAVLVTGMGLLFFLMFYTLIRIEELEQRQTRIIREIALREAGLEKKDSHKQ